MDSNRNIKTKTVVTSFLLILLNYNIKCTQLIFTVLLFYSFVLRDREKEKNNCLKEKPVITGKGFEQLFQAFVLCLN
jgi:hypothetical protein